MSILIVEDNFSSRALLSKVLTKTGYHVIESENGLQAWEILQKQPVRLVLTDLMMPEMDGLELCRTIRAASFDNYIYVIVLTSKDGKNDLVEVFGAGADDYMTKPFDPQELKARVATGLRLIELEQGHKNLQQILLQSRNKLRTVLDSLQEEIFAVSKDFNIESVNRSFSTGVGLKAETIVGHNLKGLCDETNRQMCADTCIPEIMAVFNDGRVKHHLHTFPDVDGSLRYKQFAFLPVRAEDGDVAQVIVVAKDITQERRRTDEIVALNERLTITGIQLESQNQQLEKTLNELEATQTQMLQSEKMASIGQLAAGVAHEINNPTGFVSSNLKTLSDYKDDLGTLIARYQALVEILQRPDNAACTEGDVQKAIAEVKEFEKKMDVAFVMDDIGDLIKDCREGTERIKKIVIDLKDFAHPGEDNIKSVDVNKCLESTLNVVHNEIKYKAVVETDFGEITTVSGHPQQLNQVFMNILVNAAQSIEKEGKITVKTSLAEGHVEVRISDTGCGIAKENLSKIFDPFFTTKEVGKGTGLGMNIAYNIVNKHDGHITVDSEIGKGTTFTVRLPVEFETSENG